MPQENTVPGTRIELWAGWSIALPEAYFERTPDGAWTAWGEDWTIDVQIMEIGGTIHGNDITADQLYEMQPGTEKVSGSGWIGSADVFVEPDAGRDVYRTAGRLRARNTIMSCWVSYLQPHQRQFALDIVQSVAHRAT